MGTRSIAALTLMATCLGVLGGMRLWGRLPDHHLEDDSREIVKTTAGLIATLVALVLGLLVGSAKSSFDTTNAGLIQASAKILTLDRALARYGPEAKGARDRLRLFLVAGRTQIWPENGRSGPDIAVIERSTGLEEVDDAIRALKP